MSREVYKLLSINKEFFKDDIFYIDEQLLRTFLEGMVGYIERNLQVTLCDDLDIDSTIDNHSGDARLWSKNSEYVCLYENMTHFIMKCKYDDCYCEDIYDWMEEYVPELYQQHIEYDKKINNNEKNKRK